MPGEEKESQVGAQLRRLEAAIEKLHESVGNMESGLRPILRDDAIEKSVGPPEQELVSLAADIATHAEQIERLVRRIDGISSRIEL